MKEEKSKSENRSVMWMNEPLGGDRLSCAGESSTLREIRSAIDSPFRFFSVNDNCAGAVAADSKM